MIRKIIMLTAALVAALALAGCDDAEVAKHNNAKAADNFDVQRRIVFFNGITDTYLLSVEGRCSINADVADDQLEVICKIADGAYKTHFLGLSDNVSYFVEQLESSDDDPYHYRVTFKPEAIIPDIDLRTS